MKFSIITIYKHNPDGTIDGSLLQNKMAQTVDEATAYAKDVKAVNGNKIDLAIVSEVSCGYIPPLTFLMRLTPLVTL